MSQRLGAFRDALLLLSGLALLAHETMLVEAPRELLLILVAAMLGLPASLRVDKLFVNRGTVPEKTEEEPKE